MSLANLSRIESLSGQRQGCPFGCPGPLDEIDRLLPCCNARNVEKVGLEGTFQPDSFYRIRRLDILADRTMTRIATGSITDIQSTAGRLTAADLLAGHHSFLQKSGAHRSQPAR
jgi:hypothetical protein